MLGNKPVVDVDATMVRSGFGSHEISLLRPAFGNNDLTLVVNPSHMVMDLPADENVVVRGRDWTFKTFG
jgi:hypothetical protein